MRKKNSWEYWRKKDIDPVSFNNEPTEGFIINRAGCGYGGWRHRQSYCRVYDPRGFEIEITFENLLYILETNEIHAGKVIQRKFVTI